MYVYGRDLKGGILCHGWKSGSRRGLIPIRRFVLISLKNIEKRDMGIDVGGDWSLFKSFFLDASDIMYGKTKGLVMMWYMVGDGGVYNTIKL